MSDNVLNGDLFRFYKTLISKIDPSKYEYKTGQKVTKIITKSPGHKG